MTRTRPTIMWDFDGTLAYREGMFSKALLDVLDRHDPNHGVSIKDIRPHLRQGFPWHTPEKPHLHLDTHDKWWAVLVDIFTDAFRQIGLDDTTARFLAYQARSHYVDPKHFTLYSDTLPTLTYFAEQGWQNVILSNHVPELPDIANALGLGRYVTHCITSAAIGYEKPHPKAFRTARNIAGNPETVWMVGDSLAADVRGAEAVGIKAILVRNHCDVPNLLYSKTLKGVIELINSQ